MSRAEVMAVLTKEFLDDNVDKETFPYLDDLIKEILVRHYQSMNNAIGCLKLTAYRVRDAQERKP